jgi:two-component system sensor histidine kinase RpfC
MKSLKRVYDLWSQIGPDGEQQMVVNRFFVGIFALCFNFIAVERGYMSSVPLIAACLYLVFGVLIMLHLIVNKAPSHKRRMLAVLLDCSAASYELHIGGGATVWELSGYLWIIFGNGFRFGARYLGYAVVVATVGFVVMVVTTRYWLENPAEILGALISLAIVPFYALLLTNRLSIARRQAEEANRAKSLFLAGVSHELRTPLNSIIGMGAMLERSDLNQDQWQMSRTIMTAARSLLSLIDGVLDLSKAEEGRMVPSPSDFNLAELLKEIRTIFAGDAAVKGIQINLHITTRTPLLLHGDARKLHEILLNLVGNAMKFTDAGSITVTADAIGQQDSRLRLRFQVTDTGIGIAPEAHEKIFEVFTQADSTIVNRFGGTGLGLAIVRKSVELLGGEIGVESALGKGSMFWFELPMEAQRSSPPMAASLHAFVVAESPAKIAPLLERLADCGVTVEPVASIRPGWPVPTDPSSVCLLAFAAAGATPPLMNADSLTFIDVCERVDSEFPLIDVQRKYASTLHLPLDDDELNHVLQLTHFLTGQGAAAGDGVRSTLAKETFMLLVADDNATNRYVIETILSSAGHGVTLVSNGEQALDALAEGEFDAAVLDVNMPVMGGIDTAKFYRMTTPGHATVPLIALTADATPATRESCLSAGMAACLVKPIEPLKLLETIDELVHKSREGQPKERKHNPHPHVIAIAAHPRFRGNNISPVDFEVLGRLSELGGEAFLVEVCDLFRTEVRTAMLELQAAAAAKDVARFRSHAHALRSVGANVGAHHLCEICRPFQSASANELMECSTAWLTQITEELARVDTALTNYCNSPHARSLC